MNKKILLWLLVYCTTIINAQECPPCPVNAAQFCAGCFENDLLVQGDLTVCGTTTFVGPVVFDFTGTGGTGCTNADFVFQGTVGITESLSVCGFINTDTDYRLGQMIILKQDLVGDGNLSVGFGALDVDNGEENTAVGNNALGSNTTGDNNSAFGSAALAENTSGDNNNAFGAGALASNDSGSDNVAVGTAALASNVVGINNIGIGTQALFNNTASGNVAVGFKTLFSNTTGVNNIGIGSSLLSNTIGTNNIAIGFTALLANVDGINNVAIGGAALAANVSGNNSVAIGFQALLNNDADNNIAIGFQPLFSNTSGQDNVAIGNSALLSNTLGNNNVAIGSLALLDSVVGLSNTAVGAGTLSNLTVGSGNIALGINAGINLLNSNDAILIGNAGTAADTNLIRIGAGQTQCFIAGIRGVATTIADAIPVLIDSAGQLGTISSSARFKENIQLMPDQTELLMALRPVKFNYKHDQNHRNQYGLIAEEVAEIYPDLVVYDNNGNVYTVNYMSLIPLLLAQIQTLEKRSQDYERKLADLQAIVERVA